MAEKRITTVDEMRNPDEGADFVLIVRGTQRDVRRLRLNLLPGAFDLHDDVDTELTSLAGIDRLLISDEGSPGAPQKFVRLSTLQSFLTNLFDLHDDVTTELTEAADGDRLLISDEDQSGDPQKWISVLNFFKRGMQWEKLSTEIPLSSSSSVTVSHNLGRIPTGFQYRLICKVAEDGFAAGDEVFPVQSVNASGSSLQIVQVFDATTSEFKVRTQQGNVVYVPNKAGTGFATIVKNNWRIGLSVWG